jgi:hypothetical protein
LEFGIRKAAGQERVNSVAALVIDAVLTQTTSGKRRLTKWWENLWQRCAEQFPSFFFFSLLMVQNLMVVVDGL